MISGLAIPDSEIINFNQDDSVLQNTVSQYATIISYGRMTEESSLIAMSDSCFQSHSTLYILLIIIVITVALLGKPACGKEGKPKLSSMAIPLEVSYHPF